MNISPIYASILVVLLPLLAFAYQALAGKRDSSGLIATICIALSTVISGFFVFAEIWKSTPLTATFSWFTVGIKTFTVGILLNNLTVLMQFLVCIIALPVHIYSRSYMKGDPGIHRYWMYLSLFCFAMLGLTISKNLLMMYIFWELVGFASYLLIGYWFTKEAAVQANKKAFIINRIGDLGFLIGIGLVFSHLGTLDLVDLFGKEGIFYGVNNLYIDKNTGWITGAGIAFFIGAMAKSAQFPLHVWLPDAMEGPTSVSSLIHAATMVAAGVFLAATLFPLFNETVLLCITIIGTLTAASSAYFALTQHDIKKVLAFSTISQLGFMIVGIGIGAWDAAIFHLVTHAFFKCLLFLCAGAVIHEMTHVKSHIQQDFDSQDMRNMGGLRQYMPKTFILMTIASLALAGFPLTSGFLSKDAIVVSAFEWAIHLKGLYMIVPIVLVIVSILTAFYIGRLIFKTFFGELRIKAFVQQIQFHEAPPAMLIPMLFLGVCCLFFVFSPNPFAYNQAFILQGIPVSYPFAEFHSLHMIVPLVMTLGALISWFVGWKWYVKHAYPLREDSKPILLSQNQAYLNEWNERFLTQGTLKIGEALYWFDQKIVDGTINGISSITKSISIAIAWIDQYIVDGLVNVIAKMTYYIGHLLRWIQNGRLQGYIGFAFTMVLLGILYLIIT